MARWDLIGVAGPDVELRPIVDHDVEMAADHVPDVAVLTGVPTDQWADIDRPAPAGLEDEPADRGLVELDDVDPPVFEPADLIGRREAPALETWHPSILRKRPPAG